MEGTQGRGQRICLLVLRMLFQLLVVSTIQGAALHWRTLGPIHGNALAWNSRNLFKNYLFRQTTFLRQQNLCAPRCHAYGFASFTSSLIHIISSFCVRVAYHFTPPPTMSFVWHTMLLLVSPRGALINGCHFVSHMASHPLGKRFVLFIMSGSIR